jgi:hypothetical protein
MSRNFEVQVEVFPCTTEQSTAVVAVLRQWGMTIEGECPDFDDLPWDVEFTSPPSRIHPAA